MNILSVSNFSFSNPLQFNKTNAQQVSVPKFGLTMAAPLSKDTVSFGSTAKNVNRVINSKLSRDISKSAKFYEIQVAAIFTSILAPLMSTDETPDNVIEYFNVRTKGKDSIGAKSGEIKGKYKAGDIIKGGKKCKTKDVITLNMTDLLGAKAVLTIGSKQNAKMVVEALTNAVKNGQIRLREIEQKIPKSCMHDEKTLITCAYATDITLDKMKSVSEKRFNKEVRTDYRDFTPSNYSALHFLFDVLLKDPEDKSVWKTVEVQVLGHDVNEFKELDDILYKLLNGKNVDKKYNSIKQVLQPIILPKGLYDLYDERNEQHKAKCKEEGKKYRALTYAQFTNTLTEDDLVAMKCPKYVLEMSKEELASNMTQRDAFNRYRADVFLSQRLKGAKPNKDRLGYDGKLIIDFLPITDPVLPLKYSMNSLYQLKMECEKKAAKSTKNV